MNMKRIAVSEKWITVLCGGVTCRAESLSDNPVHKWLQIEKYGLKQQIQFSGKKKNKIPNNVANTTYNEPVLLVLEK